MLNLNEVLLDDISEVNLAYLMLAQRLLQKNFARGRFRLGLSEEVAKKLLHLTPAQMLSLAETKRLITTFALTGQQLQQVLQRDKFGSVLQQAHLTILATQQSIAEAVAEHGES